MARMVAAAFLGPPPAGAVVRHLDWDLTNNRVANLKWVDRWNLNMAAKVDRRMENLRRYNIPSCRRNPFAR